MLSLIFLLWAGCDAPREEFHTVLTKNLILLSDDGTQYKLTVKPGTGTSGELTCEVVAE
jgi:hypothetical protein